jgi:hypothetical protein
MDPRRHNDHTPAAVSSVSSGGGSILSTVLVVLLIVTSIMAIAWFGIRLAASSGTSGAIKGKQYQALFLTNGQVYFGHLKNVDNNYVKLSDIYYLQVQQQVQPADKNTNNQSPQVSLAKLGSELHGPEDAMYINHDQVLFWENLKDDGKVAQAIKDYQSGNKK